MRGDEAHNFDAAHSENFHENPGTASRGQASAGPAQHPSRCAQDWFGEAHL